MHYNWQHPQWPHFDFDLSGIHDLLYQYAPETRVLLSKVQQLSHNIQDDAMLDIMTSEALKTSEIEGEFLRDEDIRSSLKKELGMGENIQACKDPRAILGISKLMISNRNTFDDPLTKEDLFMWQMVMTGFSQITDVGRWRSGLEPVQIISGPLGYEKVHFEAPPSSRVDAEMDAFILWFNQTTPSKEKNIYPGPVRVAITHLYFESIHPFEDGNGRIGRALAEKALSQEMRAPTLLSLSTTLQKNKKGYYDAFSQASTHSTDITNWITYFVKIVFDAQKDAEEKLIFFMRKVAFWTLHASGLNKRQEKALESMFRQGTVGFEGGISAKKYMLICDCSKATATRDLSELLALRCLTKIPGAGRSTRYELALPEH